MRAWASSRSTALRDAEVAAFREKVTMELDDEINAAYPRQWIGRATVRTTDGRIARRPRGRAQG